MTTYRILFLTLFALALRAQETVNHSTALKVIPWTMRYDFPGTCSPSQRMTLIGGTYGSNDYVCGLTNNWIQITGGGGGGGTWGSITGTLSDQTDLNTALGLKAPLISPAFTTPNIGAATATSVNGVGAATIAFLDATSSIQTQMNGKAAAAKFVAGAGALTGPATSGTVSPTPGANGIPQLDGSSNLALPGNLSIGTTLSVYQVPLPTPTAPTVTQAGTAGSTSKTYAISWIRGTDSVLESVIGAASTTTTSNATLSPTDYNVVTPPACPSGVSSYVAYNTSDGYGPMTPTPCGTSTNDQGQFYNIYNLPTGDSSTGVNQNGTYRINSVGNNRWQYYVGDDPTSFSGIAQSDTDLAYSYAVMAYHQPNTCGLGAGCTFTGLQIINEATSSSGSPTALAVDAICPGCGQAIGVFASAYNNGDTASTSLTGMLVGMGPASSGDVNAGIGYDLNFTNFGSGTFKNTTGFNCNDNGSGLFSGYSVCFSSKLSPGLGHLAFDDTKGAGIRTAAVNVSALPTCGTAVPEGTRLSVNNALAPASLAAVSGGGTVHVPVYCDGTNWIVN